MLKFKTYYDKQTTPSLLSEDDNKKVAVFTFGRFNPPTKGHEKLIKKVVSLAKEKGGEHFIIPSQTVDRKKDPSKSKNPLDWETKIRFMKRLFPELTILKEPSIKSPHHAIEYFDEQGFTDVYFVLGSDRIEEFTHRWIPYAKEVFQEAKIISAGTRDPDSDDDIAGMSASNARRAALEGDIGKFRAATGWGGEIVEDMMNAVRQGMGVE